MKKNPFGLLGGGIGLVDDHGLSVPVITQEHAALHAGRVFAISGKMDVLAGDSGGLQFTVPGDVAASVTINMTAATSDLTYTAKAIGTQGNDITVTHVDPSANNQALSVSVSGTDITISLATGGGGAITSTAAQVKAAVNAHAEASALVTCEDEGAGSGIVNAVAHTHLAGGSNEACVHFKPVAVAVNGGPITVNILEDYTITDVGASVLTPFNRNRESSNTSLVGVKGIADATIVNGASALTLDTMFLPGTTQGVNRTGATGGMSEELELKAGETYVVAFANSSAGTVAVGYSFMWYELQ